MIKHSLVFLLVAVLLVSTVPAAPLVTLSVIVKSEEPNPITPQTDGNETTPKYGGTLRVGLVTRGDIGSEATLNPLLPQPVHWSNNPDYLLMDGIYSRLVRLDQDGAVAPDLARNWSVSEDGCSYVLSLFDNVSWHDGAPFNSTDVRFTIDTILSDPVANPWFKTTLGDAESVEILDAHTIRINFATPSLGHLDRLSWMPILPAHIYEGSDLSLNPYNVHPVGTGPFKFVQWNPASNLTLEANLDYFRGRPLLGVVLFRWDVSALDMASRLMNNEIDLAFRSVDPDRIEEMRLIPGISFKHGITSSFYYMGFNMSVPVLSNALVRQAIAHSVNKTELVQNPLGGYAIPATGPISPINSFWYNQNVTEYEYNQTQAEELLDLAGYPRDTETGQRFSLRIKVKSHDPYRVNVTRIIAQKLEDVGITVVLEIITSGSELDDFELNVGGFVPGSDPDEMSDCYETEYSLNFWKYSNSELDSLFEEGRQTSNQTRRREIYNRAQEILAADLPNLFLYYRNCTTAYNNDFHNLGDEGFSGSLDAMSLGRIWYDPTLSGQGKSPVRLCWFDPNGSRSGWLTNGSVVQEIAGSEVVEDQNLVKIRTPEAGNWTCEYYGTGNGSVSFEFVNVASSYKYVGVAKGTITKDETKTYVVTVHDDGSLTVYLPWKQTDMYSDGWINAKDAILLGEVFTSHSGTPDWNAVADVNKDSYINAKDAVFLGMDFGQHWP